MLYIKTGVGPSALAKQGLFAKEDVPKGKIVANFGHGASVLTEEEYQREQERGNELIIMSGVRWVGRYFLYNERIGPEEYINHSFFPNLLYHAGACFAAQDIRRGDELTADYRFFLAENDVNAFIDVTTGRKVDGFSAEEALLRSGRALVELLEECNYSDKEKSSG